MSEEFDPEALMKKLMEGVDDDETMEDEPVIESPVVIVLKKDDVIQAIQSIDDELDPTNISITDKSVRITFDVDLDSDIKRSIKEVVEEISKGRSVSVSSKTKSSKPSPIPVAPPAPMDISAQIEEVIDRKNLVTEKEIKGLMPKKEVIELLGLLSEEEAIMLKNYLSIFKGLNHTEFNKWLFNEMDKDFSSFSHFLERLYRYITTDMVEALWKEHPELAKKWSSLDETFSSDNKIPTLDQLKKFSSKAKSPFSKMGGDNARFKDMLDLAIMFFIAKLDSLEEYIANYKIRMNNIIKTIKE